MAEELYSRLAEQRNDSQELKDCVSKTLEYLNKTTTSSDRPGMLLGKIQSGKTKAYLEIIASEFKKKIIF